VLAGNTLLAGDELLPVYPQQNSAFGADVYGKIRVEGTGEIILVDDNVNCSCGWVESVYLPKMALRGFTVIRLICSFSSSKAVAVLLNR